MLQFLCVTLIVVSALTETIGLYRWSQQTELRGVPVSYVAEAGLQHRS